MSALKPRHMPCADEDMKPRWFEPTSDGLHACTYCGWMQNSSPSGAAELCEAATWHSLDGYNRYAQIARAAGITVPLTPLNYTP